MADTTYCIPGWHTTRVGTVVRSQCYDCREVVTTDINTRINPRIAEIYAERHLIKLGQHGRTCLGKPQSYADYERSLWGGSSLAAQALTQQHAYAQAALDANLQAAAAKHAQEAYAYLSQNPQALYPREGL